MSSHSKKILVTRPYLPPIEEFMPYLEKMWESKHLTNMGPFHEQFEKELGEYLGVKHISLVVNGTIALMIAIKAFDIEGEVITTPFSFVATSNILLWNNIKPVFVDVEPDHFNINPEQIKSGITKNTKAILPVHVFGNPCKNSELEKISKEHDLPLIYDACHAFGVQLNNKSILNFGDLSVLSFHATKAFNTFEGGAIICNNEKVKEKIDRLRNFGIINETTIKGFGINGKMNEFQAALGLLQLRHFEEQTIKRVNLTNIYMVNLAGIKGIKCIAEYDGLKSSNSFFPIQVIPEEYGNSRDFLYKKLKEKNICSRRYFYPLISNLSIYKDLPSASRMNLPISNKIAEQVLCLPIYADLEIEDIMKIVETIKNASR